VRDDPCFHCPLPDCDDRDPRCCVRRLAKSYESKRRRGAVDSATPEERTAALQIWRIWAFDRMAEASEGGRAFTRRIAGKHEAWS
jgi:hypothetical protein